MNSAAIEQTLRESYGLRVYGPDELRAFARSRGMGVSRAATDTRKRILEALDESIRATAPAAWRQKPNIRKAQQKRARDEAKQLFRSAAGGAR